MANHDDSAREATRRRLRAYLAEVRRAGTTEAEILAALEGAKTSRPDGVDPGRPTRRRRVGPTPRST